MKNDENDVIVSCHDCDLRVLVSNLPNNMKATCPRCGYTLHKRNDSGLELILIYSITACVFLFLSFIFDFISLKVNGLENSIKLMDTVSILIDYNYFLIAIIEVITIFIVPPIVLFILIYLSFKGILNKKSKLSDFVVELLFKLYHWNMADILLLGILVTLIKVVSLANVSLGVSFISFILFTACFFIAVNLANKEYFYQLFKCNRASHNDVRLTSKSSKMSVQQTWALIFTAILLYVPANILPIMKTHLLGQESSSTIIGGVLLLWEQQSYPIAIIVFVASVLIPIMKILLLIWLNYSVQCNSTEQQQQRLITYRMAEWVGPWSMIDVFVVIMLVSLIQFDTSMSIEPGAAIIAFSGVVIMTMLAAFSFNQKLIYNPTYSD